MKHILTLAALVLFVTGTFAQTEHSKFSFTYGNAIQKYHGDLGCEFFNYKGGTRGAINFSASYYLTKSFDAGFWGFIGDYGYCQPNNIANTEIDVNDRCPGCINRVGMGNLSARMTSGGFFAKYKFANGYLLNEFSKIRPYVYGGMVFNHVTDRMKRKCVQVGNYTSFIGGAGISYYLTKKFSVGLDLTLGYFTSDKIDFIDKGSNDMYMQQTLFVGFDLY